MAQLDLSKSGHPRHAARITWYGIGVATLLILVFVITESDSSRLADRFGTTASGDFATAN